MNEEKKDRRLKGSVLFTVVSVMSLLIIFLMGTLVLAVSANNRAHKSFSSSQTQYTARAAVDSILASVSDAGAGGDDLRIAINGLSSEGQSINNITVDVGDPSMGRVTDAEIRLIDLDYPVYDGTAQQWVTCKKYSITATVELGKESTTVTSYILADAPVAVAGGGGGGFTSAGKVTGAGNHTSAVGGTYIGLGGAASKKYTGVNPDGTTYDLTDKLYLSDSGRGYDAAGNPVGPIEFGNGYLAEAPVVIDGSFQMNSDCTFLVSKAGDGVAIWGDANFSNYLPTFVSPNMNNDDSDLTTPDPDKYDWNKIPYLYVDGNIKGTQFKFGDGNFPLNLFCGSINLDQYNNFEVKGDVYCYDADKSSTIGCQNAGNLYRWAASVITGGSDQSYFGGNFYSKGSVKIDSMNFGDVDATKGNVTVGVEGDVEVTGRNVNIYGDLVVGGTLKIGDNVDLQNGFNIRGNAYADMASGKGVVANKALKAGYTEQDVEGREILVSNFAIQHNGWLEAAGGAKGWFDEGILTDPMIAAHISEQATTFDAGGFTLIDETNPTANYGGKYLSSDGVLYYVAADAGKERTVTKKQYLDPSGAVVDEADAFDYSSFFIDKNNNGTFDLNLDIQINPVSAYTNGAAGGDPQTIFPEYAEKAVILGLETLPDGSPVESTQVLKTVQQLAAKQLAPTEYETQIPSNMQNDVATNVYDQNNLPTGTADPYIGQYVINESGTIQACTISGSFHGKIINIVPPDNGEMWIKLDNVSLESLGGVDSQIVVDDTSPTHGNVRFMVEGTLNLNTNAKIWPLSFKKIMAHPNIDIWISNEVTYSVDAANAYLQSQGKPPLDYTLADIKNYTDIAAYDDAQLNGVKAVYAPIPNIYFYSGEEYLDAPANTTPKNQIIASNDAGLVGYVKAPFLRFSMPTPQSIPNDVFYDNSDIFQYVVKEGIFGCLICFDGAFQNNWVNIYIPEGGGAPNNNPHANSGLGGHTYQAVDYIAYN